MFNLLLAMGKISAGLMVIAAEKRIPNASTLQVKVGIGFGAVECFSVPWHDSTPAGLIGVHE